MNSHIIDPNDELILECEFVHENENAIKVKYKGVQVWLPKSKIKWIGQANPGDMIEVELPIWLARRTDMV